MFCASFRTGTITLTGRTQSSGALAASPRCVAELLFFAKYGMRIDCAISTDCCRNLTGTLLSENRLGSAQVCTLSAQAIAAGSQQEAFLWPGSVATTKPRTPKLL